MGKTIDKEELGKICDAKDTLCRFCDCCEECDSCWVTNLVNEAFNSCDEYQEESDDYDNENEDV